LKDAALKTLRKSFDAGAFNFSEYDAETAHISDLISAAMTPALLSDKRIIVLKGAEKLKKGPAAELASYLRSPSEAAMLVVLLDRKTDAAELIVNSLSPESAQSHFAPLESADAARYAGELLKKEGISAS